ncbi:MAG: DUF5682 family protein [Acidimicrobiales bacterium]
MTPWPGPRPDEEAPQHGALDEEAPSDKEAYHEGPHLEALWDDDGSAGVDRDRVATRARALLRPPVLYVPIRHHSPTCAVHVETLIRRHRPRAVLVEGPPSFDDQIDLLLDPAARMPLAVYAYVTLAPPETDLDTDDEPVRVGSYFPLCDYSPELVALRTGREVGARLGFVDLDHARFARFNPSPAGHGDERHLAFSGTLATVARRLGCRDHNELWDQLVEGAGLDTEGWIEAVVTYATLARAGADPAALVADGTTAREAAMARGVVAALRADGDADRPVLVVTGAFHTVTLPDLVDELLAVPPTGETSSGDTSIWDTSIGEAADADRADPEVVDRGHGLIRYSFDQLDVLAGYASGIPDPAWYQAQWESRHQSDRHPAHEVIAAVAASLRQDSGDGQPSLPAVVDAFVAAEQLRRLRGRAVPTRNDVIDAMVSCFTKGEDTAGSPVRRGAHMVMSGFALGAVPPSTPRVPLARDFERELERLGWVTDSALPRRVNLDVYRRERDRQRSRFLHGLDAIGVRYGTCVTPLRFSRYRGRDVVREGWIVELTAATDVTLTEASVWGAAISEAVAARTTDELNRLLEGQPGAVELMRLVMTAAQRGVPTVVDRAVDELRVRVAVIPSLVDVVGALNEAELLWLGREPLGGPAVAALPDLAEQLYVRACRLGADIADAPPEDQRDLMRALQTIDRLVSAEVWDTIDPRLWGDLLAGLHHHVGPGGLAGAVAGLQWRAGIRSDVELIGLVAGHLDPSSEPTVGADFLEGLVLVARDALWEIEEMVPTVTAAVTALDERQFLRRVAGLRAAFAALTPRQTDRLAAVVAAGVGANPNVRVAGVEAADVIGHAALDVAAVDQLVADGLGHWLGDGPGRRLGDGPGHWLGDGTVTS